MKFCQYKTVCNPAGTLHWSFKILISSLQLFNCLGNKVLTKSFHLQIINGSHDTWKCDQNLKEKKIKFSFYSAKQEKDQDVLGANLFEEHIKLQLKISHTLCWYTNQCNPTSVNPIQMLAIRNKTNAKRRNKIVIEQNLPGDQHVKPTNQLQLKLLQPRVFSLVHHQVPDLPREY